MKISVLTPSYNAATTLERAILSVQNQNYHEFEHIIVDAGSKDGTVGILEKFQHVIWVSEKDNGQSDAMNKAIKMSTGDIIVFLNADDEFEMDTFEHVSHFFQENSDADMVVGNLWMLGRDYKILVQPSVKYEEIIMHHRHVFPLNPVCYFYRTKIHHNGIYYNTDNHYTMDYEFLLQVYQRYKIKKTEKVLGVFYNYDNKTASVNAFKLCRQTVIRHLFLHDKGKLLWFYIITYSERALNKITRIFGFMK